MRRFAALCLLPVWVAAAVRVSSPSGIFVGTANASTAIESFLGIRYAAPPVGALRFKAPVPVKNVAGEVRDASAFGSVCPQMPVAGFDPGAPQAEDCLFLNVYRPAGTGAGDKLPVLFWIHGGAFTRGSSSDPTTDPTGIMQRGAKIGKPIVFVSINWRVNTFGFLASRFVPPEHLNVGMQDQRVALHWVQDNIASFGGDPDKVTVWGQSAGAGSVEFHILFPDNRSLFRGGIADSSTGPFKSTPFPFQYDEPGKPFARLTSMVNCPSDARSFACLQGVPFETLRNASNFLINNTLNNQLWQPAVGPPGTIFPERQSARIASGRFLHVPFLAGTNNNEGTFFSSSVRNVPHAPSQEDALFDNFVGHLILDNRTLTPAMLNEFHRLYPANGSDNGAPFESGDSLFDRAAAWYTDTMFLAPRRLFFDKAASTQPLYTYRFMELIPGNDPALGATHASELKLLFGINTVAASEAEFAANYTNAYLNFVHELNPGDDWPRFTLETQQVMQLMKNNMTPILDDWNPERTTFLNSPTVLDAFEK